MEKVSTKLSSLRESGFSKKSIITVLAVIVLVVLFIIFGTSVISDGADISRLENQKSELSVKLEEQNKQNEEYQAILDSEDKDDYIEQRAREDKFAYPNEIVFYDISGS